VPLTRYSLFTNARYELSEHVEVYTQARFDETQTSTRFGDFVPAGNQWGVTIPYGNTIYAPSLGAGGVTNPAYQTGGAYGLNCGPTGGCLTRDVFPVAPEFATLLDSRAAPNSNWTHNFNLTFMPKRGLENTQQTYEMLAGLRGSLGIRDWTYDFFASRGNTTVATEYLGFVDAASYQALISLPNYGKGQDFNNGRLGVLAHCTSGLNPFLNTPVSQDCIDIIDSNAKLSSQLEQMQSEFNVQGGLFDLPAGELRFAAGLGYRKNTYQYLPDHGMQTTNINSVVSGQFDTTETRGQIVTKEIYGEVLAPVLKDLPFVQSLELNAGFRYSDYDTNAGGDATWKLTANWDVNDYVKVRGGRQVANRAPNIAELFSPAVFEVVTWTDHDPCSNLTRAPFGNVATNPNQARVNTLCSQLPGVNGQPNGFAFTPGYIGQNAVYFNAGRDLTQGNLDLQSEEATTWTAGVVFRSPFESDALRNMTLSVDWYQIKIDGAISTTTTSYVYQECFNAFGTNPNYDPDNTFCQRIIRDGLNGNWLATQASFANLSSVETSGIDSTLDYRLMTPFLGGRTGTMSLTVNASWLLSYDVQVAPNLPAFSYKDSIGDARFGAQYKYKTITNLGYAVGPASVNLSWRHLPRVRHNSVVTNSASTTVPTSSYELFGLNGRWAFNDTWSVRGGVDNLFDRQPVRVGANFVPTATGSGVISAAGTTDTSNYDIVGRRFYLGATARF
jgi:outer membrane receptor protein involved in Fe transport